jgi:hypothetical protein
MVSTIGSGMLGLTMNCVRCHDHKFDPLPQQDYYGIAAALATHGAFTGENRSLLCRDAEETGAATRPAPRWWPR